jgi:hypothetical protein
VGYFSLVWISIYLKMYEERKDLPDVDLSDSKMEARGGNYKFKSLKIFGSSEYLGDNEPLYRLVFDSKEVRYIYFELYFYNNVFDESSWETTVIDPILWVSKKRNIAGCMQN